MKSTDTRVALAALVALLIVAAAWPAMRALLLAMGGFALAGAGLAGLEDLATERRA